MPNGWLQESKETLNAPSLDAVLKFAADNHAAAVEDAANGPRGLKRLVPPTRTIPVALLTISGGPAGDHVGTLQTLTERFRQQVSLCFH